MEGMLLETNFLGKLDRNCCSARMEAFPGERWDRQLLVKIEKRGEEESLESDLIITWPFSVMTLSKSLHFLTIFMYLHLVL